MQAPACHSFSKPAEGRICHFTGQNTEATRYPSTNAFRRCTVQIGLPNSVFGIVSQDTHRQALTGLSWLSFSRSRFLAGYPNLVRVRLQASPPEGSPRRHTLNAPAFAGPNPVGGFAAAIGRTPTLKHDDLDAMASRHFRIAPIPGATLTTSWLTEQASQGKASPRRKEIVSPRVTMQPSRTIG